MSVEARISVYHSPRAAALNPVLLRRFCEQQGRPGIRQSHFFGGRYENVYLGEEDIPELFELAAIARDYAAQILDRPAGDLRHGCWFNYMGPGHSTTTHTHDDDDELLSAVYYVTVPEHSGKLEFPGGSLPAHRPSAGEFVFFPPTLAHCVGENRSGEYRLSIAFNFGLKAAEDDHSPQI